MEGAATTEGQESTIIRKSYDSIVDNVSDPFSISLTDEQVTI